MSCCACNNVTARFWIFGCSVFVLLIALILGLLWPTISTRFLYSSLVLKNGSLNYENWKETPIPMYLEFYMFNWTNADKVKTEKPHFVELGPYVFKEKHIRDNITWHNDSKVTFYQKRIWHYVPELSNGCLDDEITNLNTIAMTVMYMTRNFSFVMKSLINQVFRFGKAQLTITKTVRELLFEGYDDIVLDLLTKLPPRPDMPVIPFDRFGWFVDRNESLIYDGNFTMYTGESDISMLGVLDMWNGARDVKYYRGDCKHVKGTTGEVWPPIPKNQKPDVTIFATDFCRPMTMKHAGDFERYGISGYKWVGDDSVFDNGKKYPEMACFCLADEEQCPDLLSGVFNASACKFGAPAFVSYPHFYLADPSYLDAVSGLKPNKSEHEFMMALEPTTGIPLAIKAQLQINLMMEPIEHYNLVNGVPKAFIPMFWFRQLAELTPELASEAWLAVNLPNFGIWMAIGLAVIGFITLVSGMAFVIISRKRLSESREDLIEEPNTISD